jgi:DNA-binding sugar fermentation-stimulating protein
LAAVQARWPTAVIFKFNDSKSKGIPDAQITHKGHGSIWIEFKDADKESVESLMNTDRGKLQLFELRRLAREGATALIVVFRDKRTCVYDVNSLDLITDRFTLAEFLAQ